MPLLLLLALAGCHGLFDPTRVSVEGSATPVEGPVRLVAGSNITVTFDRRLSRTLMGSSLVSTTPSVLAVGEHTPSTDTVVAILTASTPGDARIELLRDGKTLGGLDVEVRAPDRFTLHPVGPRLAQGELQDAEPLPSLLEGASTRFLVTWHAGAEPLVGQGATTPADHCTKTTARAGDVDTLYHDSIIVSACLFGSAAESEEVWLLAGGVPVRHPIRLRRPEEVVGLRLDGPTFRRNWILNQGFVMARAVDAAGDVVHGAPVTWQWGQEPFPGEGEVFRYTVGESARPLRASYGAHGAEIEVSGSGGTVLDVTRACSVVPGAGWVGVALALLVGSRRRVPAC